MITPFPALAIVGRLVMKMNSQHLRALGLSMTDPPALQFAGSPAPKDPPPSPTPPSPAHHDPARHIAQRS